MPGARLLWRTCAVAALAAGGGLALLLVAAWDLVGDAPGARARLTLWALAAAVLAGGAAFWAARRLATPFEEAADVATRLAEGESGPRLPSTDTAELDALSEAVNQLARELLAGRGDAARQRTHQDAVLASMTEGVLAVDSSGRVITLNPSAARLFHMTGLPYLGRTLAEVVRDPDILRFVAGVERGNGPAETEIALRAGAGLRHLRVGATPLADREGRRLGTLMVLSDITRLRELENVRRDFVANVSHELKTPVTAIKGAVDTLLDGAADDPDARGRFLPIIQRQSERLSALISDTLSLARIEQTVEQGAVGLSEGDLAPVLESAVAVCELLASGRNVKVEVHCDPALSARIDPPLLEQAVINLLQNAITYSPPGGQVAVGARDTDAGVWIEVSDQGPGIAPEHLARIFERFYRVDPARSREAGGTGLGLAIVKHIALAHGGRVSVDSTPGRGSTFRIHLPKP
jgi:two-component system phosphate regulon sensor histidine kinase PhoR